jgi:biopolymer transport protein ExbD
MGEVNTDQKDTRAKGMIKKGKKLSTRVDMTPVVDLAFLLLTFFMLATTFIKPQVMEIYLPDQTETKQPKVNEKKVLSIVLNGDNKIYWYVGMTDPQIQETDYSATGIRKVLQEQNRLIDKIVVLIKPDTTSTYENLVDILDEIEITGIARFALVDMGDEDKAIMAGYPGTGEVQPAGGQGTGGLNG